MKKKWNSPKINSELKIKKTLGGMMQANLDGGFDDKAMALTRT